MNILSWALFGLIVGIVTNAIDPHPSRGGVLGAIVLGVIGAMAGGLIATTLFGVGVSGFDITSFLVAVAGSLVVMFAARAVKRV